MLADIAMFCVVAYFDYIQQCDVRPNAALMRYASETCQADHITAYISVIQSAIPCRHFIYETNVFQFIFMMHSTFRMRNLA